MPNMFHLVSSKKSSHTTGRGLEDADSSEGNNQCRLAIGSDLMLFQNLLLNVWELL
jgi:hypothetical protein